MNARLCGRRFWFRLLFFGLLCFVVTPLSAEVLFMRDGSRISGRIVSQTRDEIIIRTDSGTRRVEKRNVTRVVYNSDVARLLENDPNAFVIRGRTKPLMRALCATIGLWAKRG